MLAIACAVMCKPRILLLDEPSMGLSPLMVTEIGKIVREINETGTTVLLVEQNSRLALKLAERAYVLETGNIVVEGAGRRTSCTASTCAKPIWASDGTGEPEVGMSTAGAGDIFDLTGKVVGRDGRRLRPGPDHLRSGGRVRGRRGLRGPVGGEAATSTLD